MATSSTANDAGATATRTCDAAGWLALAASPTFALMAVLAVSNPPPVMLCSPAPGTLPIDGMTAMYLLMSAFHLSPWLKLASARLRAQS